MSHAQATRGDTDQRKDMLPHAQVSPVGTTGGSAVIGTIGLIHTDHADSIWGLLGIGHVVGAHSIGGRVGRL